MDIFNLLPASVLFGTGLATGFLLGIFGTLAILKVRG